MAEQKTRVRLPRLPTPEFFSNCDHTILSADGGTLLSYDPVTSAAFAYSIPHSRWTIIAPCSFEDFANWAALSGYRIQEGEDARRWIHACTEGSARGARLN